MKIAQINNSQANFKGGIIAKIGAVEALQAMHPGLLSDTEKVLIKSDLPEFDCFLFPPQEKELENKVFGALNFLHMLITRVGDSIIPNSPPLTMAELMKLGDLGSLKPRFMVDGMFTIPTAPVSRVEGYIEVVN